MWRVNYGQEIGESKSRHPRAIGFHQADGTEPELGWGHGHRPSNQQRYGGAKKGQKKSQKSP